MTAAAHASVRATMNYSADNGRRLDTYFYEPDPSVVPNLPGTEARDVLIHDGWPRASAFSVDREGFELHDFAPGFTSFEDDAAIKSAFYAQIIAYVKEHTSAQRVEVFDHTIRKRLPADLSAQTTVQRPAVLVVHSDYTEKSGPQRLRDLLPAEADALLTRRVAFYNVWKPLRAPVEELPLAMCDASTQVPEDLLTMDLKYRERTGEIHVMRANPAHRWTYFPGMDASQALLLKTYDSETDGRARFMFHSAFEHPHTAPDAKPRESIEVRVMAFF
ncbi:CmcJ/NvfI family oxidoreductase [uncultured Nevskia sp.]|uniref:CmcJ/NvfI family oxidoreductase n=1 Tax=uncultured Nevskia sp. TaxID=228950 RepID=UPI0025F04C47|nr:CmcJ/NvfI family oxidoreductase [uncultured Nevskia sp.]